MPPKSRPIPDSNATTCGVTKVDMPQIISGDDWKQPFRETSCQPPSKRSSLAVAMRFLDAALRLWDEDRVCAKSQIKVAAAILRGYSNETAADARSPDMPIGARGLAPWQARKVREFIESSLDSTIRLRDCAGSVKLSAGHFSHAFKATFGTTVNQYIRHRRIEQAQRMMLRSQEPLSQIALACGFADQAHYCRAFRDVVGLSPNTWRRRNMAPAPGE